MYYPIGWPRILDGRGATGGAPLQLLRHRTKNIVFELREHSIAVWNTRLHLLLASYKLSPGNINKHGVNRCATIKPDGTCLAIATTNGLLYYLHVMYNSNGHPDSNWKYSFRQHGITRHTPGLEPPNDGLPLEQVSLSLSHEVVIPGCSLVLCPVAGSLMVPSNDCTILRMTWEGMVDRSLTVDLKTISFTNERPPFSKDEGTEFIVDIAYSLELHGLAIVTSEGTTVFITGKSARFQPQDLHGFWLKETSDCVCVAINPKYNLILCGRNNGLVDCYILEESTGSWILTNTLQLSKLHFADSDQYQLGPVQCLIWSPVVYSVLVVVWKNGGLSMWSVFGSLLFHSLGNQPGTPTPLFRSQSTLIQSACWSLDGYQLWMLPRGEQLLNRSRSFHQKCPSSHNNSNNTDSSSDQVASSPPSEGEPDKDDGSVGDEQIVDEDSVNTTSDGGGDVMVAGSHVIVLQFLKSGFVNNPITSNHNHLILHSSDQVYLGPSATTTQDNTSNDVRGRRPSGHYGNDANAIGGLGKADGMVPQWNIIQFPSTYLVLNWPIQYIGINDDGNYLAAVGRSGFAIYLMKKRKWKLFGSELQEQNLQCRGGVSWYKDILIFPCKVKDKNTDEIHFYNISDNLDSSRVLQVIPLPSPAIKVNTLNNYLVIATRDSAIMVFALKLLKGLNKSIGLNVVKMAMIPFAAHLSRPWVSTLVSIAPSTIRTETGKRSANQLESIILNISGRAIMLQKEQLRPRSTSDDDQENSTQPNSWTFSPPVSLAPYVEAVWTPPINSTHSDTVSRDYMIESLWFSCGAHGIKVWLPLYPQDEVHHTFLSKRIMLTLPSSQSFPQCILLSRAMIVGVSHEPLHGDHTLKTPLYFPPTTVRRITRLFLNHVLRQLLKRNLGSHAFHIARSQAGLPYFAHILELMLHEILEEEASCSIPIPDALLPRAIEFIKQFPHFFETVGSCARKTEVALWQYLFAAVGNPKDLFELCLSDTKLKTAATYLIIIQNLEPSSVSRHMATRLLDSALDNNQWDLCRDLVRFLKAIGPVEYSNPASPTGSLTTPISANPKTPKSAGTPKHSGGIKSSNIAAIPDLDQSVASVARYHLSSGSTSNVVSVSGDYCDSSGKVIKRPHFALDMDTKEEYFIELILSRHARKLLSSKCIRDLGLFASHLDFDLVQWMSKERHRAAHVDDYIKALLELHKQFHWPLPSSSNLTTPTSITTTSIQGHVPSMPEELGHNIRPREDIDSNSHEATHPEEDYIDSKTNLRRPNRPPDLKISSDDNTTHVGTVVETVMAASSDIEEEVVTTIQQQHSSTPSKLSGNGSYSFASESMIKNISSEGLLQNEDNESFVESLDQWDTDPTNSEWLTPTRALQSENEIRYFVELTRQSMCLEWNILLGVLLQDVTVFSDTLTELKKISPHNIKLPNNIWVWLLEGINSLSEWASKGCPGYLNFLALITPTIHQYQAIITDHIQSQQEVLTDNSELSQQHPCTSVETKEPLSSSGGDSSSNTMTATLQQSDVNNTTSTYTNKPTNTQQTPDEANSSGGCIMS